MTLEQARAERETAMQELTQAWTDEEATEQRWREATETVARALRRVERCDEALYPLENPEEAASLTVACPRCFSGVGEVCIGTWRPGAAHVERQDLVAAA